LCSVFWRNVRREHVRGVGQDAARSSHDWT
jgi:hypothetical protein